MTDDLSSRSSDNILLSLIKRPDSDTQLKSPDELTDYSTDDSEFEEQISHQTKYNIYQSYSIVFNVFIGLGLSFWHLFDLTERKGDEKLNSRIVIPFKELKEICDLDYTEEDYKQNFDGVNPKFHSKQIAKRLASKNIRLSDFCGYFPNMIDSHIKNTNENEIDTITDDTHEMFQKRKAVFILNLQNYQPFFMDVQGNKKRPKIQKVIDRLFSNVIIASFLKFDENEKDKSFIYRMDVAVVDYHTHEEFNRPFKQYLYFDFIFDAPYNDEIHFHPLKEVWETSCLSDRSEITKTNKFGGIVADNELTRMIFKWLAIKDSEFEKSGNKNIFLGQWGPESYRQGLFKLLQTLID